MALTDPHPLQTRPLLELMSSPSAPAAQSLTRCTRIVVQSLPRYLSPTCHALLRSDSQV